MLKKLFAAMFMLFESLPKDEEASIMVSRLRVLADEALIIYANEEEKWDE